jgi:hypothetical protein
VCGKGFRYAKLNDALVITGYSGVGFEGDALSLPRSIDSTTPFVSKAREYVEKGWGVVPLPEKRKEYPPTGFTGRAGKFADEDDLVKWLSDPQYAKGNIALLGSTLMPTKERTARKSLRHLRKS